MNALAVIEAASDQLQHVRDRFRRFVGIRLERERARARLDDDDRTRVLRADAGAAKARSHGARSAASSAARHRVMSGPPP